MTTPRAAYSVISSASRVEILALLQARSRRTIAELTEATGLHPNTVREHLQRLVDEGIVIPSTERRTTRGRPRTLYSAATGDGEASSPVARRRVQASADRGDLMRRIMPWTASSLGEQATHQIDAIVDHLVGSGFDPVVDDADLTIDLSPCPHAPGSGDGPQLRCAVHLGIMQSVLTQAGGPLRAVCVRLAERPEECVVELAAS